MQQRIQACLGQRISGNDVNFRLVRDVAPNKRMFLATLRLSEKIAFQEAVDPQLDQVDRSAKRARTELA